MQDKKYSAVQTVVYSWFREGGFENKLIINMCYTYKK